MRKNVSAAAWWALALGLCASFAVSANSSGWPGATQRPGDVGGGCTGCHGTQGTISVQFSGAAALLPGATARYTVTVSGINKATAKVGFGAAVNKVAGMQPTFSTVAGEPEATNDGATQIVHSNFSLPLKTATAGSASYLVDLTMPANATLGSTYMVWTVANAGKGTTEVGWQYGSVFPITVAPPTPSTFTPDQASATGSQIALSWSGTQGEHFRVLRKTGGFPTGATDAGATVVYEGANTSGTATGLSAGTLYYFAVYGKAPTTASYSSGALQATAATLPANPASLSAMTQSSSEISLSWTGTSSQFRVLGKSGSYPSSATDGSAELVYEGSSTSVIDSGLNAGTTYFYRVLGKTAGAAVYSSGNAQASAATAAQPTPRYISASGNDESGANHCSDPASPCRSITQAMARAGAGDTLSVGEGHYSVASGEVFPIAFKSGVQLQATGAVEATIIDGSGDSVAQGLFGSSGNSSSLTAIRGFTLRRGLNTPVQQGGVALGGALFIQAGNSGTFTIEGNVFAYNEARGYSADGMLGQTGGLAWGGAIAVFSSNVVIRNNLFVGNQARGGAGQFHPDSSLSGNETGGPGDGGAVYFAGTGELTHNSFVGNLAVGGDGGLAADGVGTAGAGTGGAVAAAGDPAPAIYNNLFSGNRAELGAGQAVDASSAGALVASNAPAVLNNLFHGNLVDGAASIDDTFGTGAVQADPKFHSAALYRLRNSSPARAAAVAGLGSATDLDGATRPNPPAIGAYEASLVAQSIDTGPAPTVSVGGTGTVSPSGGASGNALVVTSQTPGACTVAGTTVSGVSASTCTLAFDQAGNTDFAAASQQTLSFMVLAGASFPVTVGVGGSGSGTVSASGGAIDCGSVCSANFASGTSVTLTATADAGSVFAGWSGSGCGGTSTCVLAVSGSKSVTAHLQRADIVRGLDQRRSGSAGERGLGIRHGHGDHRPGQ